MGDDIWYGDIYAGAWHFYLNDTLFQKAMLCTCYMDDVDDLKYLLASQKWGEQNLINGIHDAIEEKSLGNRTGPDIGDQHDIDKNVARTIWSFIRTEPDFDINEEQLYAVGHDFTPLSYSAIFGHPRCMEFILSIPGVDVNTPSDLFDSIINTSMQYNKCLKMLLTAQGFKFDHKNDAHMSASYLLDEREKFKVLGNCIQDTALDAISRHDNVWNLLNYFVLDEYDPHAERNVMHRGPLLTDIMHEFDTNPQNDEGETPFMLAVKNDALPVAKFLLDRTKVDLDACNKEGHTWETMALAKNATTKTREYVKEFLALDSSEFDRDQPTFCTYAVYAGPSHTTPPKLWLQAKKKLVELQRKEKDGNVYIKTSAGWVHVEGDVATPPWSNR